MKVKIEYEDGNTLLLDNVKRIEMDAVDNEVEEQTEIPEFIKKKISESDKHDDSVKKH